MSSEFTEIRLERSGFVAEVVLCHPEKRNAMSPRFFKEIESAFQQIDADEGIRVAIVRAEGPVFSAGLDLKEAGGILFAEGKGGEGGNGSGQGQAGAATVAKRSAAQATQAQYRSILALQECFTAIERCCKPVIAAVHGKCVGGGVDLISACDIRLCTAEASFSIFEARVAIVADVGTLQRITPIVGKGMAREMAYTARFIPAERSLTCGLVNEVHPDPEALLAAARAMAAEICENAPLAVQGTKLVLNYSDEHTIAEGLDYVAQWNAARLRSNDMKEAMIAFMEKRKPVFSGS
jgi:enoyl-CoA hydratase